MIIERTVGNFGGGCRDGGADLFVQHAQRHVGAGGGFLLDGKGADQLDRHPFAFVTDRKIAARAFGLGTPVSVLGNVDAAYAVGFGAFVRHLALPNFIIPAVA